MVATIPLPGLRVLIPPNFAGTLIDHIFTRNAFGEAYSPLLSIALQHQIDADEGYEARRGQLSTFSLQPISKNYKDAKFMILPQCMSISRSTLQVTQTHSVR